MMTREHLDLRRLPVWERAAIVLDRSDALGAGGSFDFMMERDPRALTARLEQLRPGQLVFEQRRVGDAEWRVTLTRVRAEDSSSLLSSALARSPLLSQLSESARSLLGERMSEHTARKGTVVFTENANCGTLGVLLEGAMAVVVGAGTRERLLFHLYPFDVFGEIEFFDGGLTMGRTVVVSKIAKYGAVPYDVVRLIGMRDPGFLVSLAASVSQRSRTLASALAAQVSQSILARVAGALLPYAAPERGQHPALQPLPAMTQAQVAAAAGTVKEVAARAIAELERTQALRRERGHIRYLDRSRLLETIDRS